MTLSFVLESLEEYSLKMYGDIHRTKATPGREESKGYFEWQLMRGEVLNFTGVIIEIRRVWRYAMISYAPDCFHCILLGAFLAAVEILSQDKESLVDTDLVHTQCEAEKRLVHTKVPLN
jgi:hypothetical protein